MSNVFFAILPDEDTKARITALVSRLQREHDLVGAPATDPASADGW